MEEYQKLLKLVLENGEEKEDRTGTGTLSVFGTQSRYDLRKHFPLLTTKRVYTKAIIHELLWFLQGNTNIHYLLNNDVNIWNADAYRNYSDMFGSNARDIKPFIDFCRNEEVALGDLGPIYGKQWRSWGSLGYDQISNVITDLKSNPNSRRHIVNAWNVSEIDEMVLPPCHVMFQFYVNNKQELSCQLYQRSGDLFLGVPFNIASYALLTHMIAQVAGLKVGEFIHVIGDCHLYKNHIEQAKLQLSRTPVSVKPQLVLNSDIKNIDDFKFEDIEIIDYFPHKAIKGDVSVG